MYKEQMNKFSHFCSLSFPLYKNVCKILCLLVIWGYEKK